MKIKVSDGQFFVNGYPVQKEFTLSEGEERKISYIARYGAGCAILRLHDGSAQTEGAIELIRWGENAELRPLEELPYAMGVYDLSGSSVTVRIGRRIEIDNAYRYEPIRPIMDPTIGVLKGQRAPLLTVEGGKEEKCFFIFSVEPSRVTNLLEVWGEEILKEGNEVTVIRKEKDLRARKITDKYLWRGDRFEHTSHTVVCTYDPPFIREQAGRLLLEAVRARDDGTLSNLLTPDLNDPNALREYFGEIECVRDPLFYPSATAIALQKKTSNGKVAMTYDFTFEGNLINNILCIDE